jgi:sterol desaturase/sphingolipid hydroxylase (fatty acid hydroxylase superfamily)
MAIPAFLVLIAIEFIVNHVKRTDYYRLNDAANSLAMGMLSRVTQILYAAIPFSFYVYFYEDFALFTWENTALTWLIAFVLYDLGYYWNHRIGHTMNISWASHVIHHSSEEYNLTTALRQTSVPNIIGWVFYIPLALLGFPPWVLFTVASLNLLYQFWVHTQLIDRMPEWYEAIFVTPSNHRVHHAKNKIYVDKNYGGVFILWDRLFKTFQPELKEEKVIFGISTQLASWNPIWGNLHFLTSLIKDAWRTQNWFDKLTLWFRATGYRPADVEKKYPIIKSNNATDKYDIELSAGSKWYILSQLVFIVSGVVFFMAKAPEMEIEQHFAMGITLVFALLSMGKVQENSPWAWRFECVKFACAIAVVAWAVPLGHGITLGVGLFALTSLLALGWVNKRNDKLITA